MAESRESSDVDKSKTDFLNRVKTVKSEIRTKFLNLRKDLEDQELSALEKVDEIEREILEKFERASASLKEISQVREQVLTGLKSNVTSKLLKKNLKMYNDEIKEIQKNSKIDSTIKLVWKLEQLASICKVSSSVGPSSQASRNSNIHTPSGKKSRISKPPLSSPKVYVDEIPPIKISGQSTKKNPILSPPKKPLFKSSLFIDPNPDYDYESNSDSDSDPSPHHESNSNSDHNPHYESNSDSNSNSDPNPNYESNSDHNPHHESNSDSDHNPHYESNSDHNPHHESNSDSDHNPHYESNSDHNPHHESNSDSDHNPHYESNSDSNAHYGYDSDSNAHYGYDYDHAPAPDYDYDYD